MRRQNYSGPHSQPQKPVKRSRKDRNRLKTAFSTSIGNHSEPVESIRQQLERSLLAEVDGFFDLGYPDTIEALHRIVMHSMEFAAINHLEGQKVRNDLYAVQGLQQFMTRLLTITAALRQERPLSSNR